MGLEVVKQEILNSAKAQADAMIAEARKEAQRLVKEAEKKMQELKEKSDADTKRQTDLIKRQEVASAELESKKMLLDAKKQIIDKVFADARKKLEELNEKKKEILIKKLLDKTKNDIEMAYIYCNKKDEKYFKDYNTENANLVGGFIAENKERKLRIDNSFETMLESIKEQELQNISKILFG